VLPDAPHCLAIRSLALLRVALCERQITARPGRIELEHNLGRSLQVSLKGTAQCLLGSWFRQLIGKNLSTLPRQDDLLLIQPDGHCVLEKSRHLGALLAHLVHDCSPTGKPGALLCRRRHLLGLDALRAGADSPARQARPGLGCGGRRR
jgi:hypothetical protein